MANDLVVQLGAKLDQFASDMNQAGDMADSAVSRIEQSFSSINPGLGGLANFAIDMTASIAGVTSLLAALQHVNGQLTEIAKNAEYVGVSVERFQQIQFAAGQGGVSNETSATDLKNVANLLADARTNENSLTKILTQNNIAYKDRNGEVISLNQYLTTAINLINRFPSLAEKTKAAQALGLSQEWVGAIHDGATAFNNLADSATDAGAVIDAQTVAKAAAFDAAWKQSSDLLGRQFKAAAGDAAAALDGLIEKANDFFTSLAQAQGKNVGESGQAKFNAYADAIDVARKDSLGLAQDVDQLTRVIEHMAQTGGDPDIIRGLQAARKEAQATLDQQSRLNDAFQRTSAPVPLPQGRPAAANARDPNAPSLTQRKDGEEAADAYDRAQESIEKYIVKVQAEAAAQGLGAKALEEFKAQAQLTQAAQQAGIPITQAVIDKNNELAKSAGDAAAALAKAKVDTAISRGQQTALLSPEDVQIANALKNVYPDVSTALNSVEASALRTNQALSGAAGQISGDLTSGLVDITTGAKTASAAFDSLAASVIKDIEQMIIKLTIVQPLMQGLQGFIGGGINLGGAGFNPIAGVTGHATGGMISGPGSGTSDSIPTRLSNGEYVVNAAATRNNKGLLDAINYGKGYAAGGVVGSQITPDMPSSRPQGMNIQVINQSSQPVDAKTQTGPNGDPQIVLRDMVRGVINNDLSSGTGVARSLKSFQSAGSFKGS